MYRLMVSGYTDSAEEAGIHIYELDDDGTNHEVIGEAAGAPSPSYCQLVGSRLYAASEVPDHGGLAMYAMGEGGIPKLESAVNFPNAAGTCFVLVHPGGGYAYGADYNSGSLCACKLDGEGALEEPVVLIQHEGHGLPRAADDPNRDRQTSPHVHTLSFVPGTALLVAVDLGLDLLTIYRADAQGRIIGAPDPCAIVEAPPLSGPRIIAYHPTLPLAALVCELGCQLILYRLSDGGLHWEQLGSYDLLEGAEGLPMSSHPPLAAHCAFSSDGRFLYASTRGIDRLTTFTLGADGIPTARTDIPCGGATPRHFALSPDNALLAVANQTGDSVTVFARDAATGQLEERSSIPVSRPSCIIWP